MIQGLHLRTAQRTRLGAAAVVGVATLGSALLGWEFGHEYRLAILTIFITAIAGLAALAWFRPGGALLLLIVMLPVYPLVFGRMILVGFPPLLFPYAKYWKDVILMVLAARTLAHGVRSVAVVDRLALALLALAGLYVALPLGGGSVYVRLLGARQLVAFVLLFLIARNLDTDREKLAAQLQVAVLVLGCIEAGFGLWNYFAPHDYGHWMLTSGRDLYAQVTGEAPLPGSIVDQRVVAGHLFVRAGGLFVSSLSLAHFMLVPLGVVVGRFAAAPRRRPLEAVVGLLCLAGLLVTLTRSAILAVPVIALVATLAASRRERLALGFLVGSVVLSPLALAVGLGEQLQNAVDPGATSTAGHLHSLVQDLGFMVSGPLGHGLSTAGATGQRFAVSGSTTAESWYFQVGIELGLIGLLLFCALMYQLLKALFREAQAGHGAALSALCVMAALAFASLVLHAFGDLPTSYAAWLLAGLALPLGARAGQAEPAIEPTPTPSPQSPR